MELALLEKLPINVLVVEDIAAFSAAVVAMLRYSLTNTSTILVAGSLAEAAEKAAQIEISVVLLDLTLPDSDGLQTVAHMSEITSAPIVVLSGQDDEGTAMEALKLGAQDYLIKGDINARQLTRSISYALERYRGQQADADRIRLYEQHEGLIAALSCELKKPLTAANQILELMAHGDLGAMSDQQIRLLLQLKDTNNALLDKIQQLANGERSPNRYCREMNMLNGERLPDRQRRKFEDIPFDSEFKF